MDIKETEVLGDDIDKHWYYISKSKALLKLIDNFSPRKIMDVGAGSGYFSKFLLNNTTASESWCVDIGYQKKEETLTENGKPIHFVRRIENPNADLVLLMDVMEHVDDDIALLRDYVEKVDIGTRFLISVPAFEWLWSPHDDFLEHRRRYTISQLEESVEKSGLSINKSCYYFGMVLPIAITTRFISKVSKKNGSQLKKHNVITNAILKIICSVDTLFFRKNKVGGLTVFCYAEKKRN